MLESNLLVGKKKSGDILLHFEGVNGSSDFVNEFGRRMILSGQPVLTTEVSKFGASSGYFNGASHFLLDNPKILFEKDYTIEAFSYIKEDPRVYSPFIALKASSVGVIMPLFLAAGGTVGMWLGDKTGSVTAAAGYLKNTWNHFAATRSGNVVRVFVNGKKVIERTLSGAFVFECDCAFGWVNNDYAYKGYIDEYRVLTNRALYEADFAVPTSPFSGSD